MMVGGRFSCSRVVFRGQNQPCRPPPRHALAAMAATARKRSMGSHWRQIYLLMLVSLSESTTLAFRIPLLPYHDHCIVGSHRSIVVAPARPLRHEIIDPNFYYQQSCPRVSSCRYRSSSTSRRMSKRDDPEKPRSSRSNSSRKDKYFDPQTTIALIGGQSVLILLSIVVAVVLHTPNVGLGPRFSLDPTSLQSGCLLAVPLGALAAFLDTIEDQYPALQDVTKATQRSVLGLLGGTFKPIIGLLVSVVLGIAAGIGEEMLFRGLLQYELIQRTGLGIMGSLGLSSLIFGLLHAVTPLYAFMAALASIYFGVLYVVFDNLAVPMACHSLYDIGALLYAHWTVARLSDAERADLALWSGPGSPTNTKSR